MKELLKPKVFKLGDRVTFTCLVDMGNERDVKLVNRVGTIMKIEEAGKSGAKAMDCHEDALLYWIASNEFTFPKFASALKLASQEDEKACTTRD